MDNGSLINTLNHLVVICTDDEKGYRTAADCVQVQELKGLFQTYSAQRAQYAAELQAEVQRLGGTADKGGSVAGVLWRGWTNLKAMVTGGDDAAVIAECQRAEEAARAGYEEALGQKPPPEVEALLQRQVRGIREAYDRLHALELVASQR